MLLPIDIILEVIAPRLVIIYFCTVSTIWIIYGCKLSIKGIFKFFREVKAEVKRITWPSKNETKKALIAVGVVVLIYLILVGGLDLIFTNLFKFIFNL